MWYAKNQLNDEIFNIIGNNSMNFRILSSVISSLSLFLILLLFLGCASTGVVLLDDTIKYTPSENVEILIEKPKRPYKVIAKLETKGIKGTSHTTILESMRQKAKSIGADAIIPTEDASEYQLPGVMYNPWLGGYQTLPGGKVPILRGYAIKYLSSFSSDKIESTQNNYIKIQRIYKQYLLLKITPNTPMNLNEKYPIVRNEMQNSQSYKYSPIGIAEVIKIAKDKVALKYILYNDRDTVNEYDCIKYSNDENIIRINHSNNKLPFSGGASFNFAPLILNGYGASIWFGSKRIRFLAEIFKFDVPNTFFRDNFENGKIEQAYRFSLDYFFLENLSGAYFPVGMEYFENSVGHKFTNVRGNYEMAFISFGIGYLLRFTNNFYFDSRVSLCASLSQETEIDVGGWKFMPDKAAYSIFFGLGFNF